MKGSEILRIVDAIHRDKNIAEDIVFEGIELAIVSAGHKHFGEEEDVVATIDRVSGDAAVSVNGEALDPDEIGDLLGRIAAQSAKQVMIQKIREAERDSLHEEYTAQRGQIINGIVSRVEGGGTALVNLGKVEAILPRGEQIPGEQYAIGDRVRSVVLEVRKAGTRVKVILSRTHPELVRRFFEMEIPEIAEHTIEIKSISREAGYRSKLAVSSYDPKIDCVGACVGVRGARIRNIVDELSGERIDIIRWNDSLQVLVPNALQPAEVEDVILCPQLGKVIVLVQEDQLSLAIGRKGQNVRLASKLVGWDIEVLTQDRLDEKIEKSLEAFTSIPGVEAELAENLVAQGFFTYDELSFIEPDQLMEMGGLTEEQVEAIVEVAEREAERAEQVEKLERERRRQAAAFGIEDKPAAPPAAPEATNPEAAPAAESEEAAEAADADPEAPPAAEEAAADTAEVAAEEQGSADEADDSTEADTEQDETPPEPSLTVEEETPAGDAVAGAGEAERPEQV
ncbi:MAG: transcription termination factor NusA [Planctomycetota bacterium]